MLFIRFNYRRVIQTFAIGQKSVVRLPLHGGRNSVVEAHTAVPVLRVDANVGELVLFRF